MIWIWCELTADVACVQKRLIEKSEEAVDKDLLIHHKEKLYVELKNILARQVRLPNLATTFPFGDHLPHLATSFPIWQPPPAFRSPGPR